MANSIFITLLTVPPIILFFVLFLYTNAYIAEAPGGHKAMALLIPALFTVIAGIMLLIATWLCLARGGLDFISSRPMVPSIVATLVALGIGFGAVGIFLGWMERGTSWVPMLGWLGGGLAPIGLGALLITCAWMPVETARQSTPLKIIASPLALVGLLGLVGAGVAATKVLRQQAAKHRAEIANIEAENAEWERKNARSPIEAVREDYSAMDPTSPLWIIAAGLPDFTDAECRAFIVDRAFKCPNFETEITQTITNAQPRYRHGCLDVIRFAPKDRIKSEWAASVAQAIELSAEQIKADPNWMKKDRHSNPDPIEHLRAMVEAARALGNPPEITSAIQKLREAVSALPDETIRINALRVFDAR